MSEGPDTASGAQGVQSAGNDCQSDRQQHRDVLGERGRGPQQDQEHHHHLHRAAQPQDGLRAHRQLQRPRGKSLFALSQSGKSAVRSWPDVKLIPQTNKLLDLYGTIWLLLDFACKVSIFT